MIINNLLGILGVAQNLIKLVHAKSEHLKIDEFIVCNLVGSTPTCYDVFYSLELEDILFSH